jgi:hypothetical protein
MGQRLAAGLRSGGVAPYALRGIWTRARDVRSGGTRAESVLSIAFLTSFTTLIDEAAIKPTKPWLTRFS